MQQDRLAAYLRVSSQAQVGRDTIDLQRTAISGWADEHEWRVAAWYSDEARSGTLDVDQRPGLAEALNYVESGQVVGIIVTTMDRFARKLTVQEVALAHIWEGGGRVFTVDQGEVLPDDPTDPMRTLVRQIMGAFAQFERTLIRGRLAAGLAAKAARGGYCGGGLPFGHRVAGGELVDDDAEVDTIDRIVELRQAGRSYRQIVDQLEAEGRAAKRAHRWTPGAVRKVYLRAS